jgi:hypothetical protein
VSPAVTQSSCPYRVYDIDASKSIIYKRGNKIDIRTVRKYSEKESP